MCHVIRELFSWKINIHTKNKIYYKINLLPKIFFSKKYYKQKFEPLLLGEFIEEVIYSVNLQKNSSKLKTTINSHIIKRCKLFIRVTFLNQQILIFQKKTMLLISYTDNFKIKNLLGIVKNLHLTYKNIQIEISLNNWFLILNRFKNSVIFFKHIFSFFSYTKKYNFLYSMENMSFTFDVFLCMQQTTILYFKDDNLYKYHLKIHFNCSQLNSIFSIFEKKNILLVQGPPGTGKTKTITGLISSIIRATVFNFKSKNNVSVKKILICAIANAAVDENVFRGFMGFSFQNTIIVQNLYKVIRIGPNYHLFVDHISFDNITFMCASEYDFYTKFYKKFKKIQKIQTYLLKKGVLFYTTLACTAQSIVKKGCFFEILILDEAAQAIEIDNLISIKNTCKKLIMIGDVHQLPSLVFSKYSFAFGYETSFFKRLQMQKYPMWFLETQYRMHPQISSFPSRKFYKNGIKDSKRLKFMNFLYFFRCFDPFIFFDTREGLEHSHTKKKCSWCNIDEIRTIKILIELLKFIYGNFITQSVGFTSGYEGQVNEIQDYFFEEKMNIRYQINTIDSFQGKEKDFMFFSCVRSRFESSIGFLSDCRRVNVAFTRAKKCFWCIGNLVTLFKNFNWREILIDVKRRLKLFLIRKPLERTNRRLIYWSFKDEQNYDFDGESELGILKKFLMYLKNF